MFMVNHMGYQSSVPVPIAWSNCPFYPLIRSLIMLCFFSGFLVTCGDEIQNVVSSGRQVHDLSQKVVLNGINKVLIITPVPFGCEFPSLNCGSWSHPVLVCFHNLHSWMTYIFLWSLVGCQLLSYIRLLLTTQALVVVQVIKRISVPVSPFW